MENNILSASDFLDKIEKEFTFDIFEAPYSISEKAMIEFAKLHVTSLYEEIKNGNENHKKWLKDKVEKYSESIK